MPKKSTRKVSSKKSSAKPKKTASKRAKKEEEDEDFDLDEEDEEEDIEEDLETLDDDMLDKDEGVERTEDEVLMMLRETECEPCDGKLPDCKIRSEFGCPPGKG